MGIELIQKAGDAFERKQRKNLNALDECDLFSAPPQVSVAVIAIPIDGKAFSVGDGHRLSLQGSQIFVVDGITTVGQIKDPPASVIDRMKTVSPSIFANVSRVFKLNGKAELTLEFQ